MTRKNKPLEEPLLADSLLPDLRLPDSRPLNPLESECAGRLTQPAVARLTGSQSVGHQPAAQQSALSADPEREMFKHIRRRALRLLARREYSQHELRNRLDRPAKSAERQPAVVVETVLADLVDQDLQSDARFAEALVRRLGQKQGLERVARTLRDHQIAARVSDPLLTNLQATEFRRAHQVWSRRYSKLPDSWAEKARQARFLLSRGFAGEVVNRILAGRDGDN